MDVRTQAARACRWTRQHLDGPALLAISLGMGLPILAAALRGQTPIGIAMAVGGLLVGGARTLPTLREQVAEIGQVLAAAILAILAAILLAGHGRWTDGGLALLAGAAAVIGGYSRPAARTTGRFIPFLVIAVAFADTRPQAAGLLIVAMAGMVWTASLALALGTVFRLLGWPTGPAIAPGPTATATQKFRRWRASLKSLAGWQYALRLVPCFAVAGVLRGLWPDHHLLWIALTVALLCQRQPDPTSSRTTQRALGAALGVAATALLVGRAVPGWVMAGLVAVLAGLGAWLRERNYLVYTACMTPLIILLMSADAPVPSVALVDRMLATLVGAALVTGANAAVDRLRRA